MKTQDKDQYDFNQASTTSEPGFEVFQATHGRLWYFHGNDVEGRATLFSQPYSAQDGAHRGLTAAIGLLKKHQARFLEDKNGWYFCLQAGNNQEVARSRAFPDREQCEKMYQYFQKVANSPNPFTGKTAPSKNSKPANGKILPQDPPARYSFRLFFYPAGLNAPLTGRIENMQNQKQATFKGTDMAAISSFLREQIPEFADMPTVRSAARRENVQELPAVLSTPGSASTQTPVELVLTTGDLPGESTVEGCTLALRHMDTQKLITLRNIEASKSQKGQLRIQLNASGLPAGTYHLNASVWIQNHAVQATAPAVLHLQGTGWIQLV